MKMPAGPLDPALFAPCGMNCLVCYKHCAHKTPCAGCLVGGQGKPAHCRRCAIKDCAREKGLVHCHACAEYPCRRINALEKSYQKRYRASLTANSRFVQEEGLAAFMARQRERYTCPVCGDIISLHDAACSECGAAQPSASFSFP